MQVRTHDLAAFATVAAPLLARDPASTQMLGTSLDGPSAATLQWLTVHGDDGEVVGLAMCRPGRDVVVSAMPDAAAAALARHLAGQAGPVGSVLGEASAARAFAAAWPASSSLAFSEVFYRLPAGALLQGQPVVGSSRLATTDDAETVGPWAADFDAEALPHLPPAGPLPLLLRIEQGRLHLWCVDGAPVAMAAVSASPRGSARIGPVYTPPAQRGHGYGRAVTAAAAEAAFAAGADEVVLYADVANPVSNHVYRSLGFVADHAAEHHLLGAPARGL